MGRRVAILCVNPWDKPGSYQPFSYAAYRIQSALHGYPGVDEVRVFDGFGWSVDRFVEEIEAFDPDIVGGSTYVWSILTFTQVMARLRQNRPDRTLILGGPSARPAMLDLAPYAGARKHLDALVLGDGEEVVREIVDRHGHGRDALLEVAGLAVPRHGLWRRTAHRHPIRNLDAFPSPYQAGLAPKAVSAHLETFRGCPLSCTFCEWGDASNDGSFFSKDYLVRELEAFAASEVLNVYQVDAGINLNTRAFRNLAAAEAEVGIIEKVGLCCEVYPSLLKEDQLDFLRKTRARIGIGLQSYNKEVLDALERPFDPSKFERCIRDLTEHCHTTAGLILGLPGDSPASFRETLRRALDLPCNLRVYHCLVLPDALMTRGRADYALDFDPYTLQMRSCLGWTESDLRREHEFLCEEVEKRKGTYSIQPFGEMKRSAVSEFGDGYSGSTGTYWYFPTQEMAEKASRDGTHGPPPQAPRLAFASEPRAAARIAAATGGAWRFAGTRPRDEGFYALFQTPVGEVEVDIQPAKEGVRSFRVVGELAYSYRAPAAGSSLPRATLRELEQVIAQLAGEVERVQA